MVSLWKTEIYSKSDCEGIIFAMWLQPAFDNFPKIFALNDNRKKSYSVGV